jgi:hypothetical protein
VLNLDRSPRPLSQLPRGANGTNGWSRRAAKYLQEKESMDAHRRDIVSLKCPPAKLIFSTQLINQTWLIDQNKNRHSGSKKFAEFADFFIDATPIAGRLCRSWLPCALCSARLF